MSTKSYYSVTKWTIMIWHSQCDCWLGWMRDVDDDLVDMRTIRRKIRHVVVSDVTEGMWEYFRVLFSIKNAYRKSTLLSSPTTFGPTPPPPTSKGYILLILHIPILHAPSILYSPFMPLLMCPSFLSSIFTLNKLIYQNSVKKITHLIYHWMIKYTFGVLL